ncbi:MAG: L,D-transpeptidase family protein [Gemmatimonadota bacterium]
MRAAVPDWPASERLGSSLETFYRRRLYRPAWVGAWGAPARADEMVAALQDAVAHGLDPRIYGAERLARALAAFRSAAAAGEAPLRQGVMLDLSLTTAYLTFADHLQRGRFDPGQIGETWPASPRTDLAGVLQSALDLGEVSGTLAGLAPPQPEYAQLQEAYLRYHHLALQGTWPTGPVLESAPGQGATAATDLIRRLLCTGDLPEPQPGATAPDASVSGALRRFQERHGLARSGRVDEATAAALGVSPSARAAQLAANLERWRWLPHDLGSRYVLVRIAEYELGVVEDGLRVMHSRVVVGEPYRQTPTFGSRITEVTLNPAWYIPDRIAREETLPQLQADAAAAERLGIRVWPVAGDSVAPVTGVLDWSTLSPADFPYHLMQLPGPANALGRVKFTLPNPFQVYLHDTPNTGVFAARQRDRSHGCIRVEGARELAAYLLAGEGWDGDRLRAAWDSGRTQVIRLTRPLPVYILYWTAWVAADGEVNFRRDLYDADQRLMQALGVP